MIFSSNEFRAKPRVHNDKIYFMTNDNAPNWKVMVSDIKNPEYANWKEFYAENSSTKLEDFRITSDYFLA